VIADILTVIWKERKGLFLGGGSRSRIITPVLIIGIVLPIMQKEDWFTTAFSLVIAILIPFILIAMIIPESFAGERERHTLETLLASRLPDYAILFGKLGLAIAFGWVATLIVLAVSVVIANIVIGDGQIRFFPSMLTFADVVISLLFAILVAMLGVLISLRSRTVQAAQQMLFTAVMILQVVPFLLMTVVPDGPAVLRQILNTDFAQVTIVLILFFGIVNVGLVVAALARFQRARLILS
jgi:ABC-2 type transport system permease protein